MLGYFRQRLAHYVRNNIVSYFFITLIFVIGVVVGALAVKTLPEEQKTELAGYLRLFFQGLNNSAGSEGQEPAILTNVLVSNAKPIILIWLLGFTVIGLPIVMFLIFTRGFIVGFTVGFLVNEYVAKGLLFAMAAVLPHNFLAVPAVIVMGVSAVAFSLLLARRKLKAKTEFFYEFMGYSGICILMLALMFVSALIEVYISPVFMKLAVVLLVGGK